MQFRLLQGHRDPELVSGSCRDKIERTLRHVTQIVAESPFSACLPALIEGAERDPALRVFHHQFQAAARKPMIELISHGIAAGEFPARIDPEIAAFALLGAIFFCQLMTSTPFPAERVPDLMETVFGSSRF